MKDTWHKSNGKWLSYLYQNFSDKHRLIYYQTTFQTETDWKPYGMLSMIVPTAAETASAYL